ncbi:MAG: N-formylglutamate amidohydrolase [Candidatus Woesebacteria bacterium]
MSVERPQVIYTAHHASDKMGRFTPRSNLTDFQRRKFSDYDSGASVPENGILTLRGRHSRGLIDLNRAPDSTTLFPEVDFETPQPHKVWKHGLEPTPVEREWIKKKFYDKYHDRILQGVRRFSRTGVVVSWDSSSGGHLGKNEAGFDVDMPAIILSNKGSEGSCENFNPNEITSCDPLFLETIVIELGKALRKYNLPDEVYMNLVYKGGYMGEHYNTRRHAAELDVPYEIQSFQIEYSTVLTHDQKTLAPKWTQLSKLKSAFEEAMDKTYANFVRY